MVPRPPPRVPIGMSDFRKLREPGILYVDKTDFVTRVLPGQPGVVLELKVRHRQRRCADVATLDRWFDNVFGSKTAADVLT